MTVKDAQEQSDTINQLIVEDRYREARELILKLLKDEPDSHVELALLSLTYYEEKQYDIALQHIEKALELAPRCPFVLWQYAGTLDMLERDEDALKVYKGLIRRGVSRIAYGECGEGIRRARLLINDCRYRAGLILASMGEYAMAIKYIKTHIANRNPNCTSIYNLRDVKKRLAIIQQGKDPRSG